jgi:uncharacterized protein YbaR (Trm112 family)
MNVEVLARCYRLLSIGSVEMSHGSIICRDCNNEYKIKEIYQESQTDTDGGLTCPDCGSTSFGI